MKVIFKGADVRAELSIEQIEHISENYEVYIADGNLIIEERG